MRLILKIDYTCLLLPSNVELKALLSIFDEIQVVESYGYGEEKAYKKAKHPVEISLDLVKDNQIDLSVVEEKKEES